MCIISEVKGHISDIVVPCRWSRDVHMDPNAFAARFFIFKHMSEACISLAITRNNGGSITCVFALQEKLILGLGFSTGSVPLRFSKIKNAHLPITS